MLGIYFYLIFYLLFLTNRENEKKTVDSAFKLKMSK